MTAEKRVIITNRERHTNSFGDLTLIITFEVRQYGVEFKTIDLVEREQEGSHHLCALNIQRRMLDMAQHHGWVYSGQV